MAPKRPTSTIRPDRLAAYDRVIEAVQGLVRKGAAIPYTSVNGNMSSYLFDAGSLALRLSKDDRQAFLTEFETRPHEAYGIVQKEYVDVPDALLEDTVRLKAWFIASHAYVAGLKPKPTKRQAARTA